MNHSLCLSAIAALTLSLAGCINPLPGGLSAKTSDPAALALLAASAEAHGGDEAFARVQTIRVSYDGEWLNNVWKLQPMLVDRGYRKASDEVIRYGTAWPAVEQVHRGPEGTKEVTWPASEGQTLDGGAAVSYDGEPIADPEVRVRQEEASAMVAEAYRMFLTGPFYFTQRGGERVAVMGKPTRIDGRECDQVLVELRPGFGVSPEDRVMVAIDRETKLVRRVRFSLDGFRKTRGATADVEMSGFREIDGLVLPTEFLEIVVHPIDREVHRWAVTDLSVETDGSE
ncbi:MAG: hypothetical protein AAFX76_04825 [Planctomycetota bacterium]